MIEVIREFTADEMTNWPYMGEDHKRMLAWARANGLDPEQVSSAFPIVVERVGLRRQIRYSRFVRDENGRMQLNADQDTALVVEETVPLLVDPPSVRASS